MNNLVELARKKLLEGEYTCVILRDGKEYFSRERGVKPLIDFLQSGESFSGAVAADKIVGAGAAHLYVLLGVSLLWSNVISESAKDVLKANGIEVYYEKCVEYIINRKGDGVCPIENAVAGEMSSKSAYKLIISTLEQLKK